MQTPGPSAAALLLHPLYNCNTNYYVATTGNDSNPGTLSSPWANIGAAETNNKAGAGVCVNVQPGVYANGVAPTHGGNASSPNGFMVYRCTVVPPPVGTAPTGSNSCLMTSNGNDTGDGNGPFEFYGPTQTANWVVIDGFFLQPVNVGIYGAGVEVYQGPSAVFTMHHLVVMNTVITGYTVGGIEGGYTDFTWFLHNRVYGNSIGGQCAAQGSNISIITPVLAPGYSPVAYDFNNPMIGNLNAVGITGQPARNAWLFNDVFNSNLQGCYPTTDANGMIADTWTHDSIGDGFPNYEGGLLVAFNVSYNNGGGGLHSFKTGLVTFANNSSYNNYLDSNDTASYRGSIDDNGGYSTTFINNISLANASPDLYGCQPNQPPYSQYNTSFLAQPLYAISTIAGGVATALTGSLTATATSMGIASYTNLPTTGHYEMSIGNELVLVTGGQGTTTQTIIRGQQDTLPIAQTLVTTTINKTGGQGSGDNTLTVTSDSGFVPYGIQNVIVGGEVEQVTGGQGSTTWNVTRGFAGTPISSHSNGATVSTPPVIWTPDYSTHNVSAPGRNQSCWGNFYAANGQFQYASGDLYYGYGMIWLQSENLANTQPQWVNVGTTSPGTQTTPPTGTDFALQPGSPAVGAAASPIPSYLNWQAIDAGAIHHGIRSSMQ